MPSIPQIAAMMQEILMTTAQEAAQRTGLHVRHRQMTGAQFVQTLVLGWLAHPDARMEHLVGVAADLGATITPQGLCERFTAPAAACLEQVLAAMLRTRMASDPAVLPILDRFTAVEIQDSTTVTLPDALANHYQGCGGSSGRIASACKLQLRWDLRSGRLDGPILQDGRASDRAVSFRERSPVGAVAIRDLGYWHLDDLQQDAADGRFWVLRLKPGTALFLTDGTRTDAVEWLAQLAPPVGELVEVPVHIGVNHRLPCRVIARAVDPAIAEARRRKVERIARRKGRTASTRTLLLCAWEILVTNVPSAVLTAEEAWILLKVRWQIELLFKLWKQHGRLAHSTGRQPYRILCELYAKLIGLLLQHWLLLAGCWTIVDRSLVRGARVVRAWAERLARALSARRRLIHILTATVAAIQRAGRQTRRKKAPNLWQLLGGQSETGLT